MSKLKSEKSELELLLNEGLNYRAGSFKFSVKPLKAITVLRSAKYQIRLAIDIEDNKENIYKELRSGVKNVYKFIAICTLGSGLKLFFFKRILYWYLIRKLNPDKAVKLSIKLLQMYDLGNFIPSIRYIAQLRITAPKDSRIENQNG